MESCHNRTCKDTLCKSDYVDKHFVQKFKWIFQGFLCVNWESKLNFLLFSFTVKSSGYHPNIRVNFIIQHLKIEAEKRRKISLLTCLKSITGDGFISIVDILMSQQRMNKIYLFSKLIDNIFWCCYVVSMILIWWFQIFGFFIVGWCCEIKRVIVIPLIHHQIQTTSFNYFYWFIHLAFTFSISFIISLILLYEML